MNCLTRHLSVDLTDMSGGLLATGNPRLVNLTRIAKAGNSPTLITRDLDDSAARRDIPQGWRCN